MLRYCSIHQRLSLPKTRTWAPVPRTHIAALKAHRLITVTEAVCTICETTARELLHRQMQTRDAPALPSDTPARAEA